jgi:F-box and WD-40 domain protein CDC4
MYKSYYKHHFVTRQNWFLGKYRQVSFPAHGQHVVTSLSFDQDKIVSGSDDQTIHIYDLKKGELRTRLAGHEGGVWALQYIDKTLVSGSTDRTVRVWDMDTGECTHVFEGHTSTVRCLQIIIPTMDSNGIMTPSEPLIVTGSRDTTLRVWRLPDLQLDDGWVSTAEDPENPFFKFALTGHTNSVRAISGQANILVSGSYDCTVRVWDLNTGECSHAFHGHRQKVYSVGYSHELQRAVSGSMDATVKVWCTQSGTCLFTLEGHNSLVGLLELTPHYLISAAADSTLRIWCPLTGKCLANLTGHNAAITCFHHDKVSNRIVSGSDGGVKVWELSSAGYGNTKLTELSSIVPSSCLLGQSLEFSQGSNGPTPIYGRFVRDVVTDVQGVWRVKMDNYRLVCAVQGSGPESITRFEILDFNDHPDIGSRIQTAGDGSFHDEFDDGEIDDEINDETNMDEST